MAAPPNSSEFFLPEPKPTLSQGDIALAPSNVVWSEERAEVLFRIPQAPDLGEAVLVPAWDTYGGSGAPLAIHETRWSPVMVLSHDCEIEKEFNRAVHILMDEGLSEEEAIRRASDDPSLDRYVVVSPLLPYTDFPGDQQEGIRSGQRIGYFPVPIHPILEEETVVHLSRACVVDRLLLTHFEKIASLSHRDAGVLRFKLSEVFSARDLSIIAELQAMIGQVIADIQINQKSKKASSLQLFLENGEIVHLEVRKPPENLPEEITRLKSAPPS